MTSEPMAAFFRVFEGLPRQGPGSDAVSSALVERLRPRLPSAATPSELLAADMGCGSGRSAVLMAEILQCRVCAIDLHRPFLDDALFLAEQRGVADRLIPLAENMVDSSIATGSLDLLWSEGAAFTVGFDTVLEAWRPLLKPGGMLVVSECSWLVRKPSPHAAAFWHDAYPDMRTVGENICAAERRGFAFVHTEVLPASAWEDEYYLPLEKRIASLESESGKDPHLKAVIAGVRAEIRTFRQFCNCYGYVFYVFQRP